MQGFGRFGGSIRPQFGFIQGNCYYSPGKKKAISGERISIYFRDKGTKNILGSETVIDIQKIRGESLI